MNTSLGLNKKRFSTKLMALLICITLLVQMFWTGGVALGATPYYFRGYDVENLSSGSFSTSGATVSGSVITMTDATLGEAIGLIALDEVGHDISTSIDLEGLEIDFSTMTYVDDDGGEANDIPTVSIDFCRTNFSTVLSTVELAKPDNSVSGDVELSLSEPIPVGTRSIIIHLNGKNTSGTNSVVFTNTSLIIHDAAAPTCSVDYNHNWTNQPVTVTIDAADSDSGVEGIYKNGVKVSSTTSYTFVAAANTSFTAYSKDYAGKSSDVQSVSITNIDTTAPAAPASLTLSNTNWTNTDVTVTVPALGTASGAPERYVYRLDGGAWADLPAGYTFSTSGQYAIDVAVEDAAGNRSSAVSGTAKIDKLDPTINKVTTVISSGSVDVTVEASDAGLSGLAALKYAEGSHDAAFFQSGGGTDITGGAFTVSAGGVFTIWAVDNAGNYDIGEYTLNTAPMLGHTEDLVMDEDVEQTVVLDVADSESTLNALIVTAEASDTNIIGDIIINKDEGQISIKLVPEANVSGGPVTITITVKDEQGEVVTDTFQVTVRPVNDNPIAVDDEGIVTDEDTSVKIDVLANDYDTADGDTLTITNAGTPLHGTAVIAGGQIRYTPAADYNGTDQFTYTISDGHGGTASATVFISATAQNDAPVAVADTAKVDEDSSVLIDVVANDTDIDMTSSETEALSLYSVSDGSHGTAVMEDGKVRYTPDADFFGKDTFSYVVIDTGGLTSIGTVAVTVKGIDDAPVFVSLNTEYWIDEDSTGAPITFSISDAETEAASLMLQAVSLDETQKLLKSSGITITGLGDSDSAVTLHITPVANANGNVTISLVLGDGFSSVTRTFTLHINNVNDAPTAKNDEVGYEEDGGAVLIETADLIANDTDIDGDTLSFYGINTSTSVGTLAQVDEDTWSYTPPANYAGDDSFTYIVSDGHGGTAIGTCVLKATPVNDPPTISIPAGPYSVNEDAVSGDITFTINDEETDAADLSVSASSDDTDLIADGGIAVTNNGDGTCALTVTPAADANGVARVTVTVSDGSAATSKYFDITINPMPDAPVAVKDKVYVPISGRRTFAVLNNDHDVDGDTLYVVSWNGSSLSGLLSFDEATQTFTYRAANGEVGTGTFTYTISDNDPTTADSTATVELTINSMTHAPVLSIIPSQYTVEDTATSPISFTVTDEDLYDTSTISVTSSNTGLLPVDYDNNVIITDLGGGSYKLRLIPVADKSGTSFIVVTATDLTGKTDSTGFWLTVYAGNDAPEAMNDTVTINEDSSATLKLIDDGEPDGVSELTMLANDTDPDGDSLWVSGMSWPSHGYMYRSGNSYIYTPYGNWNGTETLTYTISDGQTTDTAMVTIVVAPVNDAPVNYSNWVALPNTSGDESSGPVNVLSGDYDPDGDTVHLYQIISEPSYGTAVMDAEAGTITYTRNQVSPNSNGADQLTYRIIDRDTATGDYRYADAVLYIGVEFHSSLWTESNYEYCNEDDAAFTFDLTIHNPNSVDYALELQDTTALGSLVVMDNNTVQFTPAADQNGSAWINYTISSGGESATGSFYIRVYPVNDAPVIDSAPTSVTCAEDSAGTTFTVTFHDVDCSDEDLVFYAYARNATSGSPVLMNVSISVDRETGQAEVTATPVANANGELDIVVGVSDGLAETEQTVHMTVTPVDDAPTPTATSLTLYEDMDVTFSMLTSDSEVDGDDTIVSIAEGNGPAHGNAVVNADGTITYTPDADYYGPDSLVFTLTDDTEAGLSAEQTATFTVTPVNDQPEIKDLNYYNTTPEDTSATVTLTVVDVDNILTDASCYTITSDNQTLIPDSSISIAHVSGTQMAISLTPALNAYGVAIITVVASDGELTAEAEFRLTVTPVNDSPTAADDTAGVDETVGDPAGTTSVTVNILTNDSDIEPGTLKVIEITNISAGTVKNNGNGTVTYSVDGDFNGTATFDYTIMDIGGATDTATVTVTVAAQNDAPRAEDDEASTSEDNDVTISVLDNDTDPEGDTLSIDSVTEPSHGTAVISGTDIVFSPDDNYNGTDSFSYTVSDGHGGTDTAEVTVTISSVNDAPTIAKYPDEEEDWTMDEDTPKPFSFVVSDVETASESLIITINSLDKDVIANPGIVLSTNEEGQKVITVTPQENQNGVVPVEFTVSDGALSTKVTWNITILAVNDAPDITTPSITTPEDTPYPGRVTATDVEGDELVFSAGMAPNHGSVTVNEDGTFTYTPNANYVGEDIFGVYVTDCKTEHNLDYGQVHVTVTPVNDKPNAVDDTASTAEDTTVVIPVTENDLDVDLPGDTLTVISISQPSHGTASAVEGGISYVPTADWSGTDSFTYTIKDNDGEKDTATVTVMVSPVNDDPHAVNDVAETNEETAVVIPVTSNDSDADIPYGDSITVISASTPSHGTTELAEGGVRYTPETDYNGTDSFTYTIKDSQDKQSTATVTITVNPVNDLPYFVTDPENMSLTEDLANGSSTFSVADIETPAANLAVTFIISSNTTLVDSDCVTITAGTGGNRTVEVNPNDNRNGTANVKLRVTDADGGWAEYTFTVTVAAVNDDPAAQNDSATTDENTAKTIDVLANDDVDVAAGNEGDTLTLLTVSSATYGIVTIVDDKAVYTPNANRIVTEDYTDTFTYTMKDASGAASGATVTVTVTPVNDAPVITDPIVDVTIDEDTATSDISFTVSDEEDVDSGLVVTAESSNTALIPVANIVITNPGTGSARSVMATPVANGNGSATITLTVKDSGLLTDTVSFIVTVTPVDDPITITEQAYTVVEDTKTKLTVLDDADVDDPSNLSITAIKTDPAHGVVEIETDHKSVYYTTDQDSNAADTFVYTVHDALGNLDYDITVNITVTPVNDAPVVTMIGGTEFSVNEGVTQNDISFKVTDVDNNVDTEVTLTAASSNPILVLGGMSFGPETGENRTIDVKPYRQWNGTTTITITANDGHLTGSASFTFIVNSVNEAPVAVNDTLSAPEDALTFLDVLDNDTDGDLETNPDTEHLSVHSVTDNDTNAVITIASDGSGVNIQPNANYNGPVTFTYVTEDVEGATSNTATVTVTVTQVNDAPVAADETATTTEDTAVTIDPLPDATDIDQTAGLNEHPEAEELSISISGALDAPGHGGIELVDGNKIVYTPYANYNGTDSFEYFVSDGETHDIGVVTVTITQVNDAPAAGADSTITAEDTPVSIDVLANDTDVDTNESLNENDLHSRDDFTLSLTGTTTAPVNGGITVSDGEIVYTPNVDWYGTDTFSYWMYDGHGGSAEGTVTVTVTSVNDLPVFVTNPANMNLTEDLADGSSSFSVSDVETTAAELSVTVEYSSNPTLVGTGDVSVTAGEGGDRTVTVNPKDNQNGTANIRLRVTDGDGGYREYTFTVTVTPVNDGPQGDDASGTIDEDTSYTVAWNTITRDVDIATNSDVLTVTISTQAAHGIAEVNEDGNIVYTPNADWNGVDSFVYTVTDSAEASDTGTITVTVDQVNDAPVADNDSATTNEDTAVTIDVLDGDTDTDQKAGLNAHPEAEVLGISLTGAAAPAHGGVSVESGKIKYTPADDYNGTDTFEYYVTDGEAQCKGVVTVTIVQVNDNPVAVTDNAETEEDTNVTINVLANDTDVDTDTDLNQGTLHHTTDFSISIEGITTQPAHGTISVVSGKIEYDPVANWDGTDTFTYWLNDGHGGNAEGTVTVSVGGENDPPVAVDDSASADEDHTVTVNVLENDTDLDLVDTKTFVGFLGDTSGLHGTLSGTPEGVVTFVPDANWHGSFTVNYQMEDGDGAADSATITITVNAVNDNPVAGDITTSTDEDTAVGVDVSGFIGDVDIATDGDSLTVTVETGDRPAHGGVTVTGTNITYTPAANWNGTDSFVYTVTDSHGAKDTGTVTVTVAAVNDAPVADSDSTTTNEDTAVTVDVLNGDTDVDTNPALNVTPQGAVTINGVGMPAHGSADIVEGKILYTPAANWNGTDSFTYTVTDGVLTGTGTVSITVKQVNDTPVAENDFATTGDGDLVTINVLANDTDIDTDPTLNAVPDSRNDFTITAVTTPTNGTAVINNGKIDYTPGDTFEGEVGFSYTMSDGHGGSALANVTVTVMSVNDPPETPVVHTPTGSERYGGESVIHVTWSGFDIDGDILGYTLEYYDGEEWHVVQEGMTETEYDFAIPEELTSITDLQFRVNASDAEYTSDYGYSGKVEVDKDIPANIVVTMTTADGRPYVAGTWTNQSVTVRAVSVTDASAVVFSYSLEDKAFTQANNRVVTTGVHTVFIRATDEFGNMSEFGGYLVRIDKQAPAQPQVGVSIDGTSALLAFTLSSDPGGSGNSYLIMPDGSRVVAGTGITWKTAKNGTYTFKIYDVAGNSTTFTVTVNQLDESAPVITCDSGSYTVGSTTVEQITAALSYTDSESEITAKGWAISDSQAYSGAYKSYTGAIDITQPGTYYIHAYARNAFGLTTYRTFGPFIVAAVENPETGETPLVEEAPPEGDVTVDAGDIAEIAEGAVQVRLPGGEWTDSLTLEGIEPGTYIIEVMDEDGNITTTEITITDEQVAAGQWKPTHRGIGWYVWAILGFALLLLLLLLFWRNVTVAMYPEVGDRPLRRIRRLRHKRDEVVVTVAENAVHDSAYGRVTLSKAFTRRMRGKILVIMQDNAEVLRTQVPEDADGRFEAIIEHWAG